MKWIFLTFEEINTQQLYTVLQLRSEVFVIEQNCVYQDMDGLDQKAFHVLGYDQERLVAYARVFNANTYFIEASIGRVIVRESFRKNKVGVELMQKSIHFIQEKLGHQSIRISAQQYLLNFYENLGFRTIGDGYLEDGIPHINMLKKQ